MSTSQVIKRRSERLEARVSSEQKRKFFQAAMVQGRKFTEFIVSTLEEAANRILQEKDLMHLSARDRERFVSSLLNAPAPNEALKAAYRDYKDMMK